MNNKIPVLIIGAGPTGLMMACELARRDVIFRIIDKKSEPTATANAVGIQARTLEIFDQMGIVDLFLKQGNICRSVQLSVSGQVLGHVPLDHIDSLYAFILLLPQSETEKILISHLESYNLKVERSLELTRLVQEKEGVASTIKHKDGHDELIYSDWLIACDGANSAVRKKIGISFPGEDIKQPFLVADMEMTTSFPDNQLQVFFGDGTLFAAFPLGSNNYRIVANFPQITANKLATEDEAKQIVHQRSYHHYQVKAASWMSPFWIHSKIVDNLRYDRIFLAGDAAHIHSPIGAQGMNTGLQDAYNLAWKLALVIDGKANLSILDSYHSERHPIIEQIVKRTEKLTKVALLSQRFLIKVRTYLFKFLFSQSWLLKKMSMTISQLMIRYHKSAMIDYYTNLSSSSPKPGMRVPNVALTSNDDLYDYLQGTLHHVLLFVDVSTSHDKISGLQSTLNDAFPKLLKVSVITEIPLQNIDNLIIDADRQIFRRFGIVNTGIYLIRPDGYIAYSSSQLLADEIMALLKSYLIAGTIILYKQR